MPVYEYECEHCGVRFERLQRMSEAPLTDCPECGGHVHRVMQPVGVIFKGSGFYVTDNRGRSSTGAPAPKKKDEEVKVGTAGAESGSTSTSESTSSSGKGGESS
jgi:putative FmdB family regulatory protein